MQVFYFDEGRRPIFDRNDIIVNKSEDVIEKWVCKCGEQKLLRITPDKNKTTTDQSKDRREYYANKSRTVRRSRSRSFENYKTSRRRSVSPPQSRHHKVNRYSRSPQPSTSSNRYDDKNSRKSRTPPPQSKDYRNKHDRSVEDYRELSKKSPIRYKNRSRSPVSSQQYRHRYNSRSPPSRHRRTPRRSRSRSPVYRSRRSRDRSRERRYSRSPSRHISRYSPHRHRSRSRSPSKREYKSVQVPAEIQYYPGEEYWIPGPLAPRFIPRGFIQPPPPPGVYPRGPGLIPRAPIILPPFHQPYRQRYPVYNNRTIQPQKPKTITNPTTTTTTNSSTTTTTPSTVTTSQDSGIVVASSSSENNDKIPELSPKNDDNGNKE